MPIGFDPSTEIAEKKPKFEVGKWYQHLGCFDSIAKFVRLEGKTFYTIESLDGYNKNEYHKNACEFDYQINDNTCEISVAEIQKWLPDGHPEKFKPENKKYNISEFKKNTNLVIRCSNDEQGRKISDAFSSISCSDPRYFNNDYIIWYNTYGENYNWCYYKSRQFHQIVVNYEDVIFDENVAYGKNISQKAFNINELCGDYSGDFSLDEAFLRHPMSFGINGYLSSVDGLCGDYGVYLSHPKLIKINGYIVEDVEHKIKNTRVLYSTKKELEHQQPIIYKIKKDNKRLNTFINKIQSINIQLKQKSKLIKF